MQLAVFFPVLVVEVICLQYIFCNDQALNVIIVPFKSQALNLL